MQQTIEIPKSEFFKLKRNIERIAQAAEVNDLINETEAAELMELTRKGLQNMVYKNEMDGLFVIGAKGKRYWYKSKILGLNKL